MPSSLKLPHTDADLAKLVDEARAAGRVGRTVCYPGLLSYQTLMKEPSPDKIVAAWMVGHSHFPPPIRVYVVGWLLRSVEKFTPSATGGKNPAFDAIVSALGLDLGKARKSLTFYRVCKDFPGLLLAPSVVHYLWGVAPVERLAALIGKNDVTSDYLGSPAVRRLVFPDGGGRRTPSTPGAGAGAGSFAFPAPGRARSGPAAGRSRSAPPGGRPFDVGTLRRNLPAPTPMREGAPPPGERSAKRLRLDPRQEPAPRANTPPADWSQPSRGSLADLRFRALEPVGE